MHTKIISEPQILVIGNVGVDHYTQTDRYHLGGASFNQAFHLNRLLPGSVNFMGRIGSDIAGRYITRELFAQGFSSGLINQDPDLPSSIVEVTLNADGVPTYHKPDSVAGDNYTSADFLPLKTLSFSLISVASALLRKPKGRMAMLQYLDSVRPTPVFWDANLRSGYADHNSIVQILNRTTLLKLNEEEFQTIKKDLFLGVGIEDPLRSLSKYFNLEMIALTLGQEGAKLWANDTLYEVPGKHVKAIDTLGAGDAFSAMMLNGILRKWAPEDILVKSNSFAAAITQIEGATPHDASFYKDFL